MGKLFQGKGHGRPKSKGIPASCTWMIVRTYEFTFMNYTGEPRLRLTVVGGQITFLGVTENNTAYGRGPGKAKSVVNL